MYLLSTTLAAVNNLVVKTNTEDGVTFISEFIPRMISFIFVIGTVAFFFMFLIGGIKWITAGSDKGAIEGARNQIIHAITGIVVLFGVFAIARFVKALFGIELINIDFAPILA